MLLQVEMERLGVAAKNSRPYHPQTCGKVERLHQTLKRYLDKQALAKMPFRAAGPARRPCRLLQRDQAPPGPRRPHAPAGLQRRIKARPAKEAGPETHFRVRHDKVDAQGTVTLRHDSRLHHIGIGRAHKGKAIKLLVADLEIRVLDLETGELIRRLTLDPSRDYQPIGGG